MKRGLLVVAVFLGAGAVVNVAVAWSIVLWLPPAPYSVALPATRRPVQQWPRPVPSHWPAPELEMASYEGMSPGMTETITTAANPQLDEDVSGVAMNLIRPGLPCRTLEAWTLWETFRDGSTTEQRLWSIETSGWSRNRRLPCRPLVVGFTINTLFYAAVLWLPTLGPFAARRYMRNRRGLCVNCACDMRGGLSMKCVRSAVISLSEYVQLIRVTLVYKPANND